jgi:genome maintenance exonuclease 1|tara:strand:+ start:6286 stop:6972 length:687 start_codon:yes stop_codon:yes gene_type:complete
MYIPNKFQYVAISRETINGVRKYATPDGEKLPSVTTILDATKSEESKQALNNWRKRMGAQKAQEITTEAAGRGTRMHKWLETYIKTGEMGASGSNPYSIQSHLMANSIIKYGLSKCTEFWGTEVPVYYPKIYAGTTDLTGIHDNSEAIMDHKQTNKLKKREWIEDYFVQLAAYAEAHNQLHGTKIRKGVIFMCSADNVYQEFIIEGNEFDIYVNKWFERVEKYYSKFL